MLLPHGKELVGFLPLADLKTDFKDHERLRVFAHKGTTCVSCGRVGTFLALGRELASKYEYRKRGSVGTVHIDVYTDDFVLMTVDHIIPKAICKEFNWTNEQMEALSNKQPMCDPCNSAKGHKLISEWDMEIIRAQSKNNQSRRVYGSEITRSLVPNIHALLGDKCENTIPVNN